MTQDMTQKKCVIINYQSKILSLIFHNNRLLKIDVSEEEGSLLGSIYVAKVKNIVKNIGAAFVETAPGFRCFLALDEIRNPIMINRKYDGRILAEDEILVQVHKEAVKTKPPAVTCVLSLNGKYCVVSNGKKGLAYSAKLSAKAKKRLADGLQEFPDVTNLAKNYGIIIRTNAKELTEDIAPLYTEMKQLAGQLQNIMENALHRTCFSLLYKKQPVYLEALRDMHEGGCGEIVTDSPDIYEEINKYAKENPDFHLPEVRLYQDERLPLYKLYAVESRMKEALDKKVWLKSGGYLVIEPTEALTVIDVNTGKVTSSKDREETYFLMNMEAAEEIARQLILRNLSGIIVVDFINMTQEEQNKKLMAHFGDLLKKDKVKTRLIDITLLGLVEITRQKINKPLKEQLTGGNKACNS